jgi:FixJ family two-component response regulator
VILLDHCMPKVAGAEVLARLVASDHDSALVLMSAVADLHGLARAVGARHVLPKPFNGEQLLGLVGALMVEPCAG